MATLALSNDIEAQTEVSAAEHQQNYTEIETFVNSKVLHLDGSQSMDPGSQLLLGGNATTANAACTKAQMEAYADAAEASAVATAASDATSKANAAQSTAISTAASDATTKADAAEAAAKAYADGKAHIETRVGQDATGTARTLTTSWQDLGASVTLNPTKTSGVAIVSVTVDCTTTNSEGVVEFELRVDGAANADRIIWNPGGMGTEAQTRQTLTKTWVLAFSGSSETYSIWGKKASSGGAYATNSDATTMTAAFIG